MFAFLSISNLRGIEPRKLLRLISPWLKPGALRRVQVNCAATNSNASIHLLCSNNGVEPPKWIFNAKYFLDEPYFTNDEKGEFRKYLLLNSPPEFKIRNLFVLPNILSRV